MIQGAKDVSKIQHDMRPLRLHLGLGDLFVQAGLIVELYHRHGPIAVPCYTHYAATVRSIFVDYPDIEVYTLEHRQEYAWGSPPDSVYTYRQQECGYDTAKEIRLGVYHGTGLWEDFAQCFYAQAGISYEKRWESDPVPEACIMHSNQIDWPIGSHRVFVHDDPNHRNGKHYEINKLVDKSHSFHPHSYHCNSILSFFKVITTSRKIAVIDSSFYHFVDSLWKYLDPECDLQLHQYPRWPRNPNFRYQSKLKWSYIK